MKDQYKAGLGLFLVLTFCIGAAEKKHFQKSSAKTNLETPVTCSGDIYLSSQAQVDSFPAAYGCTEISGTLTISGNDITNLDSLRFVTKVDGYMFISSNPNLSDLTGLSSLSYVGGGGARITDNPRLTNLDGLDNLTAIAGKLDISNNATLTNLDGLRSLSSLKSLFPDYQCLNIANNPALTSLKGLLSITSLPGPLVIENNAALPNLDGLNSLVSINGQVPDLRVVGNASLSNIDGLSSLTEVIGRYPWVIISNNPSLPNLDGLSSLRKISGGPPVSLEISNNTSLQNVDGLSLLELSGAMLYLTVTNNPQLTRGCGLYNALNIMTSPTCYCGPHISISGNGAGCTEDDILAGGPCSVVCNGNITLTSQAQVNAFHSTYPCNEIAGTLTISGSDITNLDSLHFVTKVDLDLIIRDNPNLTNLNGLSKLASLAGELQITHNDALVHVDGLSSLKTLNNSSILSNPALVSLEGLRSITSITGQLNLGTNASLPNLDGLNSLTSIGSLVLSGNEALTNIDGLSALSVVKSGTLAISFNTSLANLNGLSSLKQIISESSASLIITDNPSLSNVDSLSSLTAISGTDNHLTVWRNSKLARCCGLYNILKSPSMNCSTGCSEVSISGNGAGCTREEILASGPCCASPDGCPPPEPTAQPTNLAFTNVTSTSMSASFTAAAPAANGYIALMRPSSSPYPNDTPVDGSVYHVGDVIGNSSVVGFGSGTSFHVTNLSASTVYYFDVYSFNGSNYLTTNPLGGSQRTADLSSSPTQPTNMIFSAVTDTTMTVSFTDASPAPNGYITLMQAFGAPYPDDAPVDGTTYRPGDVIGSSSIVVNVGSETSLDITYLSPGIDYYFDTFSYNISNGVYDYVTANPLEGVQRTTSSASARVRAIQKTSGQSSELAANDNTSPFPNPFSEKVTIPFTTKGQNTFVQIVVYDLTGRRVAEVVSQNFGQGYHETTWEGKDNSGNKIPQGIYIYSIQTNGTDREVRGKLVSR